MAEYSCGITDPEDEIFYKVAVQSKQSRMIRPEKIINGPSTKCTYKKGSMKHSEGFCQMSNTYIIHALISSLLFQQTYYKLYR